MEKSMGYFLLLAIIVSTGLDLNNALVHAESHSEIKEQLQRLEQKVDGNKTNSAVKGQ